MSKIILAAVFVLIPLAYAASTGYTLKFVEGFAANNTNNCYVTNSTYKWIYTNVHTQLPPKSVYGGYDKNMNSIFVGRAYQNGEYWPTAIVPAKRTAYITVNGKTYTTETFEVLTGDNFSWEMGYDGLVPASGSIETTKNVWIGRAAYKSALIVGKVSSKQKACLISYDNKEQKLAKYQVLVHHGPYMCNCR